MVFDLDKRPQKAPVLLILHNLVQTQALMKVLQFAPMLHLALIYPID